MNEYTLIGLMWVMRYKWRMDMDGEDHVKIYPDGRVQVVKFHVEPNLDKGYITPAGHEVVAEFESIEELEKTIADERRYQRAEREDD